MRGEWWEEWKGSERQRKTVQGQWKWGTAHGPEKTISVGLVSWQFSEAVTAGGLAGSVGGLLDGAVACSVVHTTGTVGTLRTKTCRGRCLELECGPGRVQTVDCCGLPSTGAQHHSVCGPEQKSCRAAGAECPRPTTLVVTHQAERHVDLVVPVFRCRRARRRGGRRGGRRRRLRAFRPGDPFAVDLAECVDAFAL